MHIRLHEASKRGAMFQILREVNRVMSHDDKYRQALLTNNLMINLPVHLHGEFFKKLALAESKVQALPQ